MGKFGGLGTTSAYAENTGNQFPAVKYQWNYLRVRGEYTRGHVFPGAKQELPPRTRRILTPWGDSIQLNGTTSAYAENTGIKWAWNTLGENYLRVRGEYPK